MAGLKPAEASHCCRLANPSQSSGRGTRAACKLQKMKLHQFRLTKKNPAIATATREQSCADTECSNIAHMVSFSAKVVCVMGCFRRAFSPALAKCPRADAVGLALLLVPRGGSLSVLPRVPGCPHNPPSAQYKEYKTCKGGRGWDDTTRSGVGLISL